MDSVNLEALAAMKTALLNCLPSPSTPESTPDISITKAHITPAGISGVVGINDDPPGDIIGRMVRASVAITLKASDAEQLPRILDNSITTLLGQGEGELRQAGILKMELEKPGPSHADQSPVTRDINIELLYEYRKYPDSAQGVISHTPINLTLDIEG